MIEIENQRQSNCCLCAQDISGMFLPGAQVSGLFLRAPYKNITSPLAEGIPSGRAKARGL